MVNFNQALIGIQIHCYFHNVRTSHYTEIGGQDDTQEIVVQRKTECRT